MKLSIIRTHSMASYSFTFRPLILSRFPMHNSLLPRLSTAAYSHQSGCSSLAPPSPANPPFDASTPPSNLVLSSLFSNSSSSAFISTHYLLDPLTCFTLCLYLYAYLCPSTSVGLPLSLYVCISVYLIWVSLTIFVCLSICLSASVSST